MDAKSRRCLHIATRDRREAHAPPSAPPPVEISPTVQGMGRTWRKGQRGVGDAGILQPETGEGAFCPLPVCPTPRGDVPHGPVSDDTPRMRLSPGIATTATAPPGAGEEAGGRAGWGYIATRDRGEAHAPPSAQPPVEMSPRSRVWGEPGEKAGAGWGMPAYGKRGYSAPWKGHQDLRRYGDIRRYGDVMH